MILAGDVGGTKTLLALFDASAPRSPVREATYPSGEFGSLAEILQQFLDAGSRGRLQGACFAVAGPVIEGKSRPTNLPWELAEEELAALLGTRVRLLNDLQGTGYGVLTLAPEESVTLQAGVARPGNMAVIAAGTGLGEAILVRTDAGPHVVASEGGHADFGPRTELEDALLAYLRREFGRVSYERLLSGPGLQNIYRFLRDSGIAPEPDWLRDRLTAEDPAAVISEVGLAAGHPLCVRALDLFVSIYGAEAGNLALKAFALGGVFVAGGIAPKILPTLQEGSFVAAFVDKGRLSGLMRSLPVRVILNPRVALIGAATVARELAGRRAAAPRVRQ